MQNYELKAYLKSKANLARMAEVAKYMYKTKTYPEHLEEEMRDLMAYLDAKLEKWLVF